MNELRGGGFETAEDRAVEEETAAFFGKLWQCNMEKMSPYYGLDFAIRRGNDVLGFAEVKRRNYSRDRLSALGGFNIAYGKWLSALKLCRPFKLPFWILLQLNGDNGPELWGASWYPHDTPLVDDKGVSCNAMKLIWGGRDNPRDLYDQEPMLQISMGFFTRYG